MKTPSDDNQVSSPRLDVKYNIPETFADFSLSELRTFCLLSDHLLRGIDLTQAIKLENLSRPDRERFKLIHKELKNKLGLNILVSVKGSSVRCTAEPSVLNRLRIITTCIDEAIKQLLPVVEMRKETLRPTVRIASVISVVNYLGPALLEKLKEHRPRNDKWPPNISFYSGDFKHHFHNLLIGNLDLCIAPSDLAPPSEITGISLDYTSMDQGLVFKLRQTARGEVTFKNIEDALISESGIALVDAVLESTVCLMQWELSPGYDELSRAINDFFCNTRPRIVLGPRIYVPTMRSSRQLVCRGLAVGIGHKPRLEVETAKALGDPIKRLGGVVGYDPDFPSSLLAFIPLEKLSTSDRPFPETPTNSFSLNFVGKNQCPDPQRISEETIEVVKVIKELVDTNEENRFLIRNAKGQLLHDFHSCGQAFDSL